VLALTLDIELFTQTHYRESIESVSGICPLWKDVFLYDWKEESQHAILDELEWMREDAKLGAAERDAAVTDLIELVGAVDGLLQMQAGSDAAYFVSAARRAFDGVEAAAIHACVLRAYRDQYIVSGVQNPRFAEAIGKVVTDAQGTRIADALTPIFNFVNVQ
jgi:hypothetical protein